MAISRFGAWVINHVTATISQEIQMKSMNLEEILVWLDDYCEEKPILAFEQSLADFITENYDKRMKKAPSKFRR